MSLYVLSLKVRNRFRLNLVSADHTMHCADCIIVILRVLIAVGTAVIIVAVYTVRQNGMLRYMY